MKKEVAIEKIQKTPNVYLNEDQKNIAIKIIESVKNEKEVQAYYDFIIKRCKVGFTFDYAPEIAQGRLGVISELEKLNINIRDGERAIEQEHKLIIGDNYEALKNLLLTHKNKVDIIYIDPPYNTEALKNDGNNSSKEGHSSKFIYKDKFGRNGWLNLMKERLVLAKKLLKSDGVIFVSIDDCEYAYLKVLMDEIFGEEKFISTMPRLLKRGHKESKTISKNLDYVLIYYNNTPPPFKKGPIDTSRYTKKDKFFAKRGYFRDHVTLDDNTLEYSRSSDFEIKFQGKTFYPGGSKENYIKRKKGLNKKKDWKWRWSEELVQFGIKNEFLILKREKNRIYKKTYTKATIKRNNNGKYEIEYGKRGQTFTNYDLFGHEDSNKFSNDNAKKELDLILSDGVKLDYPKPTSLIKFLINLIDKKDSIVLDFFAGSGTTGHATMQLNKDDGGNRQFILCTNNENNIAIDITLKRLKNIMVESNNKWGKKKENFFFTSEKLRVFNIKHFNIEINQSKKIKEITQFAIANLKKLCPYYLKSNLNLYYDLNSLRPYNEAQKYQVYSTDAIIHRPSKKQIYGNIFYCMCGKSFKSNNDLKKHIEGA